MKKHGYWSVIYHKFTLIFILFSNLIIKINTYIFIKVFIKTIEKYILILGKVDIVIMEKIDINIC